MSNHYFLHFQQLHERMIETEATMSRMRGEEPVVAAHTIDQNQILSSSRSSPALTEALHSDVVHLIESRLKKDDPSVEVKEDVCCGGWLWKKGGRLRKWKKRFFSLRGAVLTYDTDLSGGEILRVVCVEPAYLDCSTKWI